MFVFSALGGWDGMRLLLDSVVSQTVLYISADSSAWLNMGEHKFTALRCVLCSNQPRRAGIKATTEFQITVAVQFPHSYKELMALWPRLQKI